MQRNTINRDFVFSPAFLARKAAEFRRNQIFREAMVITAVVCFALLALDYAARLAGM
ncbi:TPA: hypothetical protein ACGQ50_000769 [Enterobacter cloacae]